jgi:enoyl-CoA hydratase/carnithine racemase
VTGEADVLVCERRGHVLVARLNRPEARNALNPALMEGIGAAVIDAESDPDIRVVVITGTGDRAFCAGLDLRSFSEGEEMGGDEQAMAAFTRLLGGEVSVPVVGAANATAVAGGFELLLGCDVIVASSEARFGLPEVKRGLFPGSPGTLLLGTRIPLSVALELTLTGDSIDAARAHALGLVNAVVAPENVLATALDYAERIAANGPLGVAAVKELVRLGVKDAARAAERLGELQPQVFASEDAQEGARAFIERRPPTWHTR